MSDHLSPLRFFTCLVYYSMQICFAVINCDWARWGLQVTVKQNVFLCQEVYLATWRVRESETVSSTASCYHGGNWKLTSMSASVVLEQGSGFLGEIYVLPPQMGCIKLVLHERLR